MGPPSESLPSPVGERSGYFLEALPSPQEASDSATEKESPPSAPSLSGSEFSLRRSDPRALEQLRKRFSQIDVPRESRARARYDFLKQHLFMFQMRKEKIGFLDDNISALKVEHDDVWIGSWAGGVARYSESSKEITTFRKGFLSLDLQTVRDFLFFDREIWCATYSGIRVYDKRSGTWRNLKLKGVGRNVHALTRWKGGVLVATQGSGLWLVEGEIPSLLDPQGQLGTHINALLTLSSGEVAVGTKGRGIFLLKRDGELLSIPQLKRLNATVLLEADGRLWVGTHGDGLLSWKIGSTRVKRYGGEDGFFGGQWILSGASSPEFLFFGSLGWGGISLFDRKKRQWSSLSISQGLPSLDIAALAYHDRSLYAGTLGEGVVVMQDDFYHDRRP